jgi:proline iminopeptidase
MTFPRIEPHRSGMLPVEHDAQLWWEESGSPEGLPILWLQADREAG